MVGDREAVEAVVGRPGVIVALLLEGVAFTTGAVGRIARGVETGVTELHCDVDEVLLGSTIFGTITRGARRGL